MRYTAMMSTSTAEPPAEGGTGAYLGALRRGGWFAALLILLGW
jgi:hypothetical protein